MKQVKRFLLFAVVVVIVLCGVFYLGMAFGRVQLASQDVGFNTVFTAMLLEELRSEKTTEAIRHLEGWLYSNVGAMSVWRKYPGSGRYREQMDRGLMSAARYRERYPRRPLVPMPYNPMTDGADEERVMQQKQAGVDNYNEVIDALLKEGRQALIEKEKKVPQESSVFTNRFVYCQQIKGDDGDVFELTDWRGDIISLRVDDVIQGYRVIGSDKIETGNETYTYLALECEGGQLMITIDKIVEK